MLSNAIRSWFVKFGSASGPPYASFSTPQAAITSILFVLFAHVKLHSERTAPDTFQRAESGQTLNVTDILSCSFTKKQLGRFRALVFIKMEKTEWQHLEKMEPFRSNKPISLNILKGPEVDKAATFDGLKWTRDIWDTVAQWTVEPDEMVIEMAVRGALGTAFPAGSSSVEHLAQGALNKVYLIQTEGEDFIVRVTLPVDPMWKTLSEVGTVDWIRENTTLPVPKILYSQHIRGNPINFEWMVMTRVPGRPLDEMWSCMSEEKKNALVLTLVKYCAETFRHRMRGIGNLYPSPTSDSLVSEDPLFVGYMTRSLQNPTRLQYVQRIVSGSFFVEDRIRDKLFRGPFSSSRDWLSTRLTLAENECRRYIKRIHKILQEQKTEHDRKTENLSEDHDIAHEDEDLDESDLKNQNRVLRIIEMLRSRLDDFFPPNEPSVVTEPEPSILFHHDLSRQNILVDDDGNLTGVVDWECVSILPLWVACDFPAFLDSETLDEEPSKANFNLAEDSELDGYEDAGLYFETPQNHNLTLLQQLFLEEMRKIEPRWVKVYVASERQRDFDLAVSSCDDAFFMRRIENWLNDMNAGVVNMKGLQQRIDESTL